MFGFLLLEDRIVEYLHNKKAHLVELVDTSDLKFDSFKSIGSIPVMSNKFGKCRLLIKLVKEGKN